MSHWLKIYAKNFSATLPDIRQLKNLLDRDLQVYHELLTYLQLRYETKIGDEHLMFCLRHPLDGESSEQSFNDSACYELSK
jgi:hypothetical protein